MRLDDPLAVGRFSAEEVEFWRDAGIYYLVPCVSNDAVIAVFALGRRASGEPLTSEDIALLTAVPAQAATAIENGRLYRQLHQKASELDRLRTFNENILESLDDGLLVIGLDNRVIRWNQALEQMYGIARAEALGQPLDRLFDADFVDTLRRVARTKSHNGDNGLPHAVACARQQGGRDDCSPTSQPSPCRPSSARAAPTGTIVMLDDITERGRTSKSSYASRKRWRRSVCWLRAWRTKSTRRSPAFRVTRRCCSSRQIRPIRARRCSRKSRKQTFRAARIVNGLLTLSRPNAAETTERVPVDFNTVIGDVLSLLEHQLDKGSIKMRREMSGASGRRSSATNSSCSRCFSI